VLLAASDEMMITPGECAKLSGKSIGWLRTLRLKGEGPRAYGPPGHIRYRLSEVCAFMSLPHPLNQKVAAE
jgi:hypothetical protein